MRRPLSVKGGIFVRKIMLFGIGFTLSCIIGVYFLSGNWLLLLGLICLACVAALLFIKLRPAKIAAVIIIGATVGFLWNWGYDSLYLSDARQYDAKTVQTQIEITDYHCTLDYGIAADGKITLSGKTYRVRCYINDEIALKPADRVTGSFRLRYTADGGEKAPTYHQGNGIFLLAYADENVLVTESNDTPAKYFAAVFRQKIVSHLDNLFPEDTLGFVRALLLGDDSKLSYDVDSAFQISGLRHVIAVSGLHVSILFSIMYLFGGRHKVVGVVAGWPVLFVFAAVAGFTPSIIRACIMQALINLSFLVDKEYDPPTALAFSALVMLAVNPLTITSVSFQLSVSCMIGIILFGERIQTYLRTKTFLKRAKKKTLQAKLANWFAGGVSITISAMITTTPLCAYYFESVSLVGILTNLLTLWVVTFIFYGVVAACILGAVWLPVGKMVAWCISWLIRYVIGIAKMFGNIPMSAVYTKSIYIVVWLIFAYVLLAVFVCSKKKNTALFCSCVSVVLCIAIAISYIEPRLDRFRISILDVGQGQCVLLQSNGHTYMVDCGGDYADQAADEAARTLLSQGITKLDGIILTHYDKDHTKGAELLLQRMRADTLYLPVTADVNGMYRFYEQHADIIQWIDENTEVVKEDIRLQFIPATERLTGNESSMCVLCRVDNCDILITGDRSAAGEKKLIQAQKLPEVDVLVVGHHGAKTTASLGLLNQTRPKIAVISVGENNIHGHPAQEVLDRLKLFGCTIVRTDQMGTVTIKG